MRRMAETGAALTDEDLLALYAAPAGDRPWTRMMFISAADGAATLDGRSGALGTPADRRVFALARRDADVILVGAGTVRAEGYDGELVDGPAQDWREAHGLARHPEVAVVSGGLHLAATDPFFTRAPRRPVVLTSAAALRDHADRAAALAEVADVLPAGETDVEPEAALEVLAARGHRVVHGEGGPSLFGAFAAAGRVDELQLSLSPVLAGGEGPRILAAAQAVGRDLHLVHVLHEESMLLLRYVAAGSADALDDGAALDSRSGTDA